MTDYHRALEEAGATIHCFKEFGSYQGDWYALVTYKGEKGWVTGAYGSCSGCDAFQHEFGWVCDHEHGENTCDYVDIDNLNEKFDASCEKCVEMKMKLKTFAIRYLEPLQTFEAIREEAARDEDWDMEAKEVLEWLDANKSA
jgi:hypothetical protein